MSGGFRNSCKLVTCVKNHVFVTLIFLGGLVLTLLRFTLGIGGVTRLDDLNPWGFWMTFDLLCGIALSAGGFVITAAYYIFKLRHLGVYVRAALTTAFLGYFFEVIALGYEVGQPWRLVYPIFWSQGTSSVLFLVGLCVFLYLIVLFLELLPAVFERLGWNKARERAIDLAAPLAVLGTVIAVIHQSSLGALYLIVPSKMHPLWESDLLPLFFLVSALFAGLGTVVVEGWLAHKFLSSHMDEQHLQAADRAVFICGKAASLLMFAYLIVRCAEMTVNGKWQWLSSSYGFYLMLELVAGVCLPAVIFFIGSRRKNLRLVLASAVITVSGVVLNRFNVSLVAFNYNLPDSERYFPSWMEIGISIFLVTLLITAYRWICSGMPILRAHEKFGGQNKDYRVSH
jgi:Ni/Fe-hydrogenase subunit HybB-like protein